MNWLLKNQVILSWPKGKSGTLWLRAIQRDFILEKYGSDFPDDDPMGY